MRYQAVLFDFDYTLGDATEAIYAGFVNGFQAMGLPAPTVEQVRYTIGMVLEEAYTHLTGDRSEEHQKAFREGFVQVARPMQQSGGVPLFPGAKELLLALHEKELPVAIVSTKQGDSLEKIFLHHGLSRVLSFVIGGEMVTKSKPDPEGLLIALDRLHMKPDQVLYCGDTTIDAQAAQSAGMDFCAVLNGTTEAGAFANYPSVHIAPDLFELQGWLGI